MEKMYVKNMVCDRCIKVVTGELKALGVPVIHIGLGEAELQNSLTPQQKEILKERLVAQGFELLDDKKSKIIEKIKTAIIRLIHYGGNEKPAHMRYSEYLSKSTNMDYSSLSKLFSEVEGITIEHYIIGQKIERAKELLVYDELTLSQIADELGYSSVAHLSSQFRKITGSTPTSFKKLHAKNRKSLDKI